MSFAADDPLSQEDACPENSNYPSEHFNQKLGPIPPHTYGANILGAVGAHIYEFYQCFFRNNFTPLYKCHLQLTILLAKKMPVQRIPIVQANVIARVVPWIVPIANSKVRLRLLLMQGRRNRKALVRSLGLTKMWQTIIY